MTAGIAGQMGKAFEGFRDAQERVARRGGGKRLVQVVFR